MFFFFFCHHLFESDYISRYVYTQWSPHVIDLRQGKIWFDRSITTLDDTIFLLAMRIIKIIKLGYFLV